MKFRVFGHEWGSGGVSPDTVLRRFVAATPVELPAEGRIGRHLEVEITPEELMSMAAAQEFDVLISGTGFLAFDGRGRGFRQR